MKRRLGINMIAITPDGQTFGTVMPEIPRVGTRIVDKRTETAYYVGLVTIEARLYPLDEYAAFNLTQEQENPSLWQDVILSLKYEDGSGEILTLPMMGS